MLGGGAFFFLPWVLCFEKMRLSDLPGLAREPLAFVGYLSSRSICLIDKGKMRHYPVLIITHTLPRGAVHGNFASRKRRGKYSVA